MPIVDIRRTGEANLKLEVDSARIDGEVSLTLEDLLEPTTITVEDGTAQGDEWESLPSVRTEDGTAQGDVWATTKTTQNIEDGTAQGDEVLGPYPSVRVEDGTAQGDEFSVVSSDTVAAEDGAAQGDEWVTLPVISDEDGVDQGDEWTATTAAIPIADGTGQGDEFSATQHRVVTLEDGTWQRDEWSLIGLRIVTLEDGSAQGDAWSVAGQPRTIFVVNADTGAVSRYQFGEDINGAAMAEDGLLVSASSGLYALDADTDAGVPIVWSLDTGFSKLGTEYLKRLRYIDVLGRFSAPPELRVVSDRGGPKREDRYPMDSRNRTAYRDGCIRIGRGLQSVFYGLGLTGTGPAEIESAQVDIEPLSRRR